MHCIGFVHRHSEGYSAAALSRFYLGTAGKLTIQPSTFTSAESSPPRPELGALGDDHASLVENRSKIGVAHSQISVSGMATREGSARASPRGSAPQRSSVSTVHSAGMMLTLENHAARMSSLEVRPPPKSGSSAILSSSLYCPLSRFALGLCCRSLSAARIACRSGAASHLSCNLTLSPAQPIR
jgi:hypothetical protein